MNLPVDGWGNPLSTGEEAAAAYRDGVDRMLAYELGVDDALRRAIDLDPAFSLPYAMLGLFHLFRGERAAARELIEQAESRAGDATEREQRHFQILAGAVRGQQQPQLIEQHLDQAPRDAPIVLQWLGGNFYGGGVEKRERMLEKFDALAPAFGDDWWFLSWHAFANHEMDRLETARQLVQRSLDLRRGNGQAAHAMSHVYFETRDTAGGSAWLGDWLDEFPHRGGFHRHLSWHHALFLLAEGRDADALALYEDAVGPCAEQAGDALGAVADSASLLWRCSLVGDGREFDWRVIAETADRAFPPGASAWVDVHRAMALAALAEAEGLGKLRDALDAAGQRGHPTAAIVAEVATALWEFAAGDYAAAADRLAAVRELLVALGGSNAQRDVFEETLVEAQMRAGRGDEALALLGERLARGASGRDLFRLAEVRSAKGELDAARQALARAAESWPAADPAAPQPAAALRGAR